MNKLEPRLHFKPNRHAMVVSRKQQVTEMNRMNKIIFQSALSAILLFCAFITGGSAIAATAMNPMMCSIHEPRTNISSRHIVMDFEDSVLHDREWLLAQPNDTIDVAVFPVGNLSTSNLGLAVGEGRNGGNAMLVEVTEGLPRFWVYKARNDQGADAASINDAEGYMLPQGQQANRLSFWLKFENGYKATYGVGQNPEYPYHQNLHVGTYAFDPYKIGTTNEVVETDNWHFNHQLFLRHDKANGDWIHVVVNQMPQYQNNLPNSLPPNNPTALVGDYMELLTRIYVEDPGHLGSSDPEIPYPVKMWVDDIELYYVEEVQDVLVSFQEKPASGMVDVVRDTNSSFPIMFSNTGESEVCGVITSTTLNELDPVITDMDSQPVSMNNYCLPPGASETLALTIHPRTNAVLDEYFVGASFTAHDEIFSDNESAAVSFSSPYVEQRSSNAGPHDAQVSGDFIRVNVSSENGSGGPTESIAIIREDCSQASIPTANCYTSLSAWENGEQRDLTISNEIAVAQIEGDWTTPDPTEVIIIGWSTSPTQYIKIYTTPEARHNGTWGNGYRRSATLTISESHVRVDGLSIRQTGSGRVYFVGNFRRDGEIHISNSFGWKTANDTRDVFDIYSVGPLVIKMWNNIGINDSTDGSAEAFYFNDADMTGYCYNCTGIANGGRAFRSNYGSAIIKNSLGFSANGADFYGNFASIETSISSDGSADNWGGTGNKVNQTINFVDAGNHNYHLASSDTSAVNAGTNLSTDADLSFSTDVDGQTRSDGWDIGADESTSGGTADTTAPALSSGSPAGTLSAGTTSTTLSVATNENATCRYSPTAGTAYTGMANSFSTTGNRAHSTTIPSLTDGGTYSYYVRCIDTEGNQNTTDYSIGFSITAADTAAPVLSSGSPTGTLSAGTTSTTLSIATNENATCRYSPTAGTAYTGMANTFLTTGNTAHSTTITSLTGGAYSYYVRCVDTEGNQNATDYSIGFSVAAADTAAPVLSSGSPTGTLSEGTTSTTLSVATNENATCRYSPTAGTAYTGMANTFSTTGNTAHSTAITSLTGGAYSYYVRCVDTEGNQNTTDYTIGFSVATTGAAAPTLSSGLPTGTLSAGTTSATLSIATNENATCRYSPIADTAYAEMESTFLTTGNTAHSTTITSLTGGCTHLYFVRCEDTEGNQNTTDYTIVFSVETEATDTTAPVLSSGSPTGTLSAGTTSTTLSIATNENATCRYSPTAGTAYTGMANTFLTTGNTAHSTTITSLTDGGAYSYYVRCVDTEGNQNTTDYSIGFSVTSATTPTAELGNYWLFYGDSETDGRASGIYANSQVTAFEAIWTSTFGAISRSHTNGVGSTHLLDAISRYRTRSDRNLATFMHFQESGSQARPGQETATEFATSFESFVRRILVESPNAIISTETAYSFLSDERWVPYNNAMQAKIDMFAQEGTTIYVADVDKYIKELVAQTSFSSVVLPDNIHYTELGNLMVAASIYDALGFDVTTLDLSGIPNTEVSAINKQLVIDIVSSGAN